MFSSWMFDPPCISTQRECSQENFDVNPNSATQNYMHTPGNSPSSVSKPISDWLQTPTKHSASLLLTAPPQDRSMNAVIASDRPIKAVNADVTILEDERHNPFCLSKFLSRRASQTHGSGLCREIFNGHRRSRKNRPPSTGLLPPERVDIPPPPFPLL